MAYKKYIKKKVNGKESIFGPYYYESYRDKNGKIKKRYLGTTLPDKTSKIKKRKITPTRRKSNKKDKSGKNIFIILSIILILSTIGFLVYNSQITGKITLGVKDSYINGENLSGDLRLNLKHDK